MRIKEILLALLLLITDQLTKWYVSANMKIGDSIKVIDGFFHITFRTNTGAAWSILQGQSLFFIIAAAIASATMIYYLHKNRDLPLVQRIAVILCLAGAVGNLIDRIRFQYVIDFLDFYIFGYDFPVFNFADSCLTIGVILLSIDLLFIHKEN